MPPQNPPTNSAPAAPTPAPKASGSWGSLIGIGLIVLLLAAGGAYFLWMQKFAPATDLSQTATTTPEAAQPTAGARSNPDAAIESDLNAAASGSSQADVDSLNQAL